LGKDRKQRKGRRTCKSGSKTKQKRKEKRQAVDGLDCAVVYRGGIRKSRKGRHCDKARREKQERPCRGVKKERTRWEKKIQAKSNAIAD